MLTIIILVCPLVAIILDVVGGIEGAAAAHYFGQACLAVSVFAALAVDAWTCLVHHYVLLLIVHFVDRDLPFDDLVEITAKLGQVTWNFAELAQGLAQLPTAEHAASLAAFQAHATMNS